VDAARLGRSFVVLRQRLGWRQSDLATRAKVSQSAVSRVERGRTDAISIAALSALATSLGARLDVRLTWQGENLDRLLDAGHAAAVERLVGILQGAGWDVLAEVSFSIYGERGSIDVFARHRQSGALLVVEVKSVFPDLQAMLVALDRKTRLAGRIAAERGWPTAPVSTLLVVVDATTARRRVREHEATLGSVLPDRGREITRWLRNPGSRVLRGLLFLPPSHHATVRRRVRRRRTVAPRPRAAAA